ncbi:isocitrate lyase/phosphoenolpyruvate mutase family protein [Nocardia tenerifensis]|uniref:isocitrate lyase/phosphoenolpyruvate mutase family protein n=1 Tax=Nocardia tenerifensis TaxID=228006 RepID=UPI0002DE21AF|nr:isocitrate lyase/phosphoenolpyruvate mutase family protein [Nocardia tenerifensis]
MSENFPGRTGATAGLRLRGLLADPQPSYLMGAHDGLSARIAAEAGFTGVWASGLCMSTVLGARDSDEISWAELLDLVARIVEGGGLPVLVDADTGYGNFNTARRFAARAERIGAAGMCLEDKVFPKMNSYFGDSHPLAPVGDMCAKLAACRDQVDAEFVLVARTEALIAGAGLAEALRRAEAYRQAGADAIFIHSRRRTVDEIAEFTAEWGARLPLVIAPTTYHTVPRATFAELGIAAVIWANQSMRAAVAAMRQVCRSLLADGAAAVEPGIASLRELFDLMGYPELEADEAHYTALAQKWSDAKPVRVQSHSMSDEDVKHVS